MFQRLILVLSILSLVAAPGNAAGGQPSVAQFKKVFETHLQKLKTPGFTVRTILFQEVRPGRPHGSYYPFQVTAIIHDYGPGYPANGYFGQTCVGKMDKWKFDMSKDDFGNWIVQGRMTVSDNQCKDNPSEGVSAMPVATLPGSPAGNSPADASPVVSQPAGDRGNIYLGEYACYGVGSRLMAGMGFHLKPGGKYHDSDGGRGGTYTVNPRTSTILFRGGFLDGQVGRNVGKTGFQLSSTVSCEPWR